jgi:pimeloyl-ACP methyl ester carboxylesterase
VTSFLVATERLTNGSRHPLDEEVSRNGIAEIRARTGSPASSFNHTSLSLRNDWTGRFRDIAAPTLVTHGEEDPVLPVENGCAIADGINGAEMAILPGVGHELPSALSSTVATRIFRHVLK